jgi:BirA family biotin operon repressor/biotin-[acetyl-CoA-carboxylase] ligase
MDPQALVESLAELPLGPLRCFSQCGSTNDEARRWMESGCPDLALVIAETQTAGRGRLDRRWYTPPESAPESALAFSLVLRPDKTSVGLDPDLPPERTMLLTALGALAVCQALEEQYQLDAQIKWPNDVLVGGRKLAGILAESHWQGSELTGTILGIGINITQSAIPPETELSFPATSIEACLDSAGTQPDRYRLLRMVLERILQWRDQVPSPSFLQAWQRRLAYLNDWVWILPALEGAAGSLPSGEACQVLGLETDGRLRLRDQAGNILKISSGEIHLRPHNSI